MAIELGAAYVTILPSTAKLAPAVRKELGTVERDAKAAGGRAGKTFGSQFKSGFARFGKTGLLAGIAGASLLGGAGLKTAAELEQSRIGFETMLGSAKAADKFLGQIKKTAAKTPFELKGLTQASQRMLAFGFNVKDVIPTLTTLGDAASGLGIGQEGLDRIVMAVGQIQAKGKVQGEELLQLTEAGIPAARILQNELGLTGEEYDKLQKQGKITAETAIPALLNGIKNGSKGLSGETAAFGGLMEKQSKSLSGLFSTLKDTLLVETATALEPLIPLIKQGLSGAIRLAGPLIRGMAAGLAAVVGAAKAAVTWVREHKDLTVALGIGLGVAVTALAAYNAYVKITAAVTTLWTKAQMLLNGTLRLNPIGLVITALAALAVGLVYAYRKSETFRKIVDGAWKGIRTAVSFAWNRVIKPVLRAWWAYMRDVLFPVVRFLYNNVVKPIFSKVSEGIRGAWNNVIRPVFTALKDFLQTKLVPAFQYAGRRIGAFWDKIQDAAKKPARFVIDTIYNKGLREMIGFLPGVDKPSKVNVGFARGGYTGRGGKYQPAGVVHRDEFVIRKEARRQFESRNPGVLDYLNKTGSLPGFAKGGRVWPVPGRTTGTYPGHDGVDINRGSGWDDYGDPIWAAAPGRISYVGTGQGYGLATFINGTYGRLVYGHMSEAFAKAGQNVSAGDLIGRVGNTGNSKGPHLHFGFPGGTTAQALQFLSGADVSGGGGGGGLFETIKNVVSSAKKVWNGITGMASGGWSGIFKSAMKGTTGGVKDWVNGKVPGPGPIPGSIFDNGGVLEPGHAAINLSKKPEAIYNQRQFKAFAESANGGNDQPRPVYMEGVGFLGYLHETASKAAQIQVQKYDSRQAQGVLLGGR